MHNAYIVADTSGMRSHFALALPVLFGKLGHIRESYRIAVMRLFPSQNQQTQGGGYQGKGMAKTTNKMPFIRVYDFLLEKKDLTPAEKMVLSVVCRYWPNPYWDTNLTIANNIGFSERYIEKIVKQLAKKKYIRRGYAHTDKGGKPHTVRVIAPLCFSGKCKRAIKWVSPEQPFGQQTEQKDGQTPNNRSFLPEQQDDLLDNKEKLNIKATPAPLPDRGQASALLDDRKTQAVSDVQRFIKGFGSGGRKTPIPTPQEIEQRKRTQIKALQAGENIKK